MSRNRFKLFEGGIVDVEDSFQNFNTPNKFIVAQIAIQEEQNGRTKDGYAPSEFDKVKTSVLVDSRLWKMMSRLDQAGLVMHEYLYNFHRSFGEKDSTKVRQINALAFSKDFAQRTQKEVEQLLKEIGYDYKVLYAKINNYSKQTTFSLWSDLVNFYRHESQFPDDKNTYAFNEYNFSGHINGNQILEKMKFKDDNGYLHSVTLKLPSVTLVSNNNDFNMQARYNQKIIIEFTDSLKGTVTIQECSFLNLKLNTGLMNCFY